MRLGRGGELRTTPHRHPQRDRGRSVPRRAPRPPSPRASDHQAVSPGLEPSKTRNTPARNLVHPPPVPVESSRDGLDGSSATPAPPPCAPAPVHLPPINAPATTPSATRTTTSQLQHGPEASRLPHPRAAPPPPRQLPHPRTRLRPRRLPGCPQPLRPSLRLPRPPRRQAAVRHGLPKRIRPARPPTLRRFRQRSAPLPRRARPTGRSACAAESSLRIPPIP